MPRPHPKEFRDDVVAVGCKGEAPVSQIAKDFGISESCLRNWLLRADVDDGHRPGQTSLESAELRELKRRNRLLDQEYSLGAWRKKASRRCSLGSTAWDSRRHVSSLRVSCPGVIV